VAIRANYQQFLIAPFALVTPSFTQLQMILEAFEKCRVSRYQGGSTGSNSVGDTSQNRFSHKAGASPYPSSEVVADHWMKRLIGPAAR
jgi:hypothetical protein